jgi:hypothetical protein
LSGELDRDADTCRFIVALVTELQATGPGFETQLRNMRKPAQKSSFFSPKRLLHFFMTNEARSRQLA